MGTAGDFINGAALAEGGRLGIRAQAAMLCRRCLHLCKMGALRRMYLATGPDRP